MGKYGKPKGWENCPRMCSEAIFGRFVAFKTPYNKVPKTPDSGESFTVSSVFDLARERNMKIGLWIDLTGTDRYFNGSEVELHNCIYVKLLCPGRDISRLSGLLREFYSTCDRFFYEHPGELVGVHCTHGFNRTGFVIVSYMIEICGWDAAAAVKEFARSRPPGIYRKDKLEELSRKFNIFLKAPPVPNWTNESNRNEHAQNVMKIPERNWRDRGEIPERNLRHHSEIQKRNWRHPSEIPERSLRHHSEIQKRNWRHHSEIQKRNWRHPSEIPERNLRHYDWRTVDRHRSHSHRSQKFESGGQLVPEWKIHNFNGNLEGMGRKRSFNYQEFNTRR